MKWSRLRRRRIICIILIFLELTEFLQKESLDNIRSVLVKLDFDLTTLCNMGDEVLSIPDINLGTRYKLINALKRKKGILFVLYFYKILS